MKNEALIVAIIDKSGSMSGIQDETISGFNQFLEDQKKYPEPAKIFTVLFNSGFTDEPKLNEGYKIIHDMVDLNQAKEFNRQSYSPAGMTALNDAIGITVTDIGKKLAALPEEERPNKILVMILTDGEENSSNIYKVEDIKKMVEHQKEVYSWEFMFLGANIDSIEVGSAYGSHKNFNFNSSKEGIKNTISAMSESVSTYKIFGKLLDDEKIKEIINGIKKGGDINKTDA